MITVLDNIRSIHNVGSIFRTADALGIEKIYLCGITPSPTDKFGKLRPQFGKVSLGAEKSIKWEKSNAAREVINQLKNNGYKIFAVEQDKKAVPYYKVNKNNKVALVLGNEIKGLSKSVLTLADKILEIPMTGAKESLNVAIAFGIVAFSLKYK
jgi:23S rRNA (guanosine2251-2'-O)-methyltransferase